MIDQLALANSSTRYTFTASGEFESIIRSAPSRSMQIYWGEILARAHLTAVTAILRSRHWINAVIAATEAKNLLAFAAAFRGLIESAADASSTLGKIPGTLARHHSQITRALSGDLKETIYVAPEIEDELIHFSHARHLTKAELATAPASHGAKMVRDYIEVLEKGQVTEIIDCYRALCDLTHPGASSVWMWLTQVSELEFDLAADQDDSVISYFLVKYRKTFVELLMFAFNPAIVTLSVLNYFPIVTFHVPQLLNWNLTNIRLWQECQSDLKGIPPQVRTPLRSL